MWAVWDLGVCCCELVVEAAQVSLVVRRASRGSTTGVILWLQGGAGHVARVLEESDGELTVNVAGSPAAPEPRRAVLFGGGGERRPSGSWRWQAPAARGRGGGHDGGAGRRARLAAAGSSCMRLRLVWTWSEPAEGRPRWVSSRPQEGAGCAARVRREESDDKSTAEIASSPGALEPGARSSCEQRRMLAF